MFSGENPTAVSKHPSFGAVLDAACERLMEWQVEYSIQRINEMESRLNELEQELDMFLQSR
jgi:hypothetical protein